MSLDISDRVLERFHLKEDDLAAMAARPKTWVDLAILQVVGEQDLVAEYLPEALDFHRSVTDQAAAHLHLLGDNTFRTSWLTAKLLSKRQDPGQGISQRTGQALGDNKARQ